MSRPERSRSPGAGHPAEQRLLAADAAVRAVDDPLEDAHVLAEARPEELAVLVLPEPVHHGRSWAGSGCAAACPASARSSRPCCSRRRAASPSGRGARRRPCRSRRRSSPSPCVAPRKTPCVQLKACSTSGTVVARRPPKMIARDRHARRVVRRACESAGLLRHRRGEAGVRVRGLLGRARRPRAALPVDELGGGLAVLALPPHVAVRGQRDVGEDRVLARWSSSRWGWSCSWCPGATPK